MSIDDYIVWFKARYRHTSSAVTVVAFIFSDFITIMLCIGAGFFVVNAVDRHYINFRSFINYWTYLPFFFIMYSFFHLYPGVMMVPSEQLRSFFLANAVMFIGIALSIVIETDGRAYVAIAFLVAFFFSTFSLPVSRTLARNVYSRFRWWGIPAAVYGQGEEMKKLIDTLLDRPQMGYIPVAIISEHDQTMQEYRGIPVLNSIKESRRLNTDLRIKMAIIVVDEQPSESYRKLITTTLSNFRYNIIIPRLSFLNTISMTIKEINGTIALSSTNNLTRFYNLAAKRLLDIILLIIGSIFAIPLTLIMALLIKLTSPGPVFYGHERIGKNGKRIRVWKFRSMVINADKVLEKILAENPSYREEWDKYQKLTNDPRVTPIGKFMRKTSIDELPQFFNILKGEMSFIGPRPVTIEEAVKYGESFGYIFSVKPGLSGMWQVSGRSDSDYEERVAFDTYYIQNWSVWLDLWLIIKTIGVLITRKGAR
ncbi:undecaprenyl-phosphate galactose phosphotransferase WbaP [Brucepastera parasyntrophica]|uniref:undecaprenyl-phosphate galactose phosphotransferase WbaP n=1 Tax=Brucepastera parasyntrophica TaxID=2880008 RepID=UPI00210DDDC3|nr:undecaprenyl-phosphate galactose phosphotransferase WbaP [Brucepastera parasyntrophica]ULQ60055.1 undecaprenyl-phosphate galactose phosphotransferase WbaP [Brucepastera parasyntrophica]